MSLPQELIEHTLSFLQDAKTLRACSLAARNFVWPSQRGLFAEIHLQSLQSTALERLAEVLLETPHLALFVNMLEIDVADSRPTTERANLFFVLCEMCKALREFSIVMFPGKHLASWVLLPIVEGALLQPSLTDLTLKNFSFPTRGDLFYLIRGCRFDSLRQLRLHNCKIPDTADDQSTATGPKLTSLEISPLTSANFLETILSFGNWTHLRRLHVELRRNAGADVQQLVNRCPMLEYLRVYVASYNGPEWNPAELDLAPLKHLLTFQATLCLGPTRNRAAASLTGTITHLLSSSSAGVSPLQRVILDVYIDATFDPCALAGWSVLDDVLLASTMERLQEVEITLSRGDLAVNQFVKDMNAFKRVLPGWYHDGQMSLNTLSPAQLESRRYSVDLRISDLEQRMASLNTQLRTARFERREILHALNAHRPSGISTLPVELLCKIFLLYIGRPRLGDRRRVYRDGPFTLAAVCRDWRAIAVSYGPLWAYLHIALPQDASVRYSSTDAKMPALLFAIDTWMSNSAGNAGIDLDITAVPSRGGNDVFAVLPRYARSLRSLSLDLRGCAWKKFPVNFLHGKFPLLERVSITGARHHEYAVFSVAPRLTQLEMYDMTSPLAGYVSWCLPLAQLTTLVCDMDCSPRSNLDSLRLCTALERFTILSPARFLNMLPSLMALKPAVLPQLKSLAIKSCVPSASLRVVQEFVAERWRGEVDRASRIICLRLELVQAERAYHRGEIQRAVDRVTADFFALTEEGFRLLLDFRDEERTPGGRAASTQRDIPAWTGD
ncbi:F-box domain-containing protein [Mycena kentingensis (nom. inval.)]|nr:F-box domain-containing protein [Mycena kentingensis (nom. inval.)]